MEPTGKTITLEFPDKASADRFLGWFCDGGGESQFFDSEDYHAPSHEERIASCDYKKAYPAWGYKPENGERTIIMNRSSDPENA